MFIHVLIETCISWLTKGKQVLQPLSMCEINWKKINNLISYLVLSQNICSLFCANLVLWFTLTVLLFLCRMPHKSILELKGEKNSRAVPYSDGITIKVVKRGHIAKFTDSNGQEGELLNFSIADSSGAMLATLSDKTKHARIVEGRTLFIRDFILKGGKVAMSHKTTIMNNPRMEIPPSIEESAVQLIMPPSPVKKVAEAKTSPLRSICSIKGQIVKVRFFSELHL